MAIFCIISGVTVIVGSILALLAQIRSRKDSTTAELVTELRIDVQQFLSGRQLPYDLWLALQYHLQHLPKNNTHLS